MTSEAQDLLSAACAYVSGDFSIPVIPLQDVASGACSCGAPLCDSAGKHPRTANGLKDASTDPEQIKAWWTRWPHANVGLVMGRGLAVLDIDGPEGEASLERLLADRGLAEMPETYEVRTPRPGAHLYFKIPEGVTITNKAYGSHYPKLDVRGEGGYVVAPPSIGIKGPYVVRTDVAIEEWPRELLPSTATKVVALPDPGETTCERADNALARARVYLDKAEPAVQGQEGSGVCFRACIEAFRFGLTTTEVTELMSEVYNPRCVPPWSDRELAHKIEDARTTSPLARVSVDGNDRAVAALRRAAVKDKPASSEDARPQVAITSDEAEVVDEAEKLIAGDPLTYQRSGRLVRVQRDHRKSPFLRRPSGAPEIAPLSIPTCREALSRAARWVGFDGRGKKMVEKRPPNWVVEDILARGQWENVRPLEGVVEAPTLRRNGTVLSAPGYDPATGLLYEPSGPVESIVEHPTHADALLARDVLLEVVADFPFASGAYRAAWLASALGFFARYAIVGRVPLTLFEAPAAGTGKTLLADTIGMIATGRELPKMANTLDDAEMRKRLLAIGLAGDPFVLLDNVRGGLGTPALDMALTAGVIRERILAKSEDKTVPLDAIFLASGNNVELLGDTRRRVLHCRIDAGVERPEERGRFRHPDLLRWIAAERPRLVAAALTILRAYHVAGRPVVGTVRPWGSFEGWQSLVCGAVRWLGLTAPEDTRAGLIEAETETEKLGALLRAWQAAQPAAGMTAGDALSRASQTGQEALREAIASTCRARGDGPPTPASVGYALRRDRGRVIGGLCFEMTRSKGVWRVATPDTDGADGGHGQTTREKLAESSGDSFRGTDPGWPPSAPSVPDNTAPSRVFDFGSFGRQRRSSLAPPRPPSDGGAGDE